MYSFCWNVFFRSWDPLEGNKNVDSRLQHRVSYLCRGKIWGGSRNRHHSSRVARKLRLRTAFAWKRKRVGTVGRWGDTSGAAIWQIFPDKVTVPTDRRKEWGFMPRRQGLWQWLRVSEVWQAVMTWPQGFSFLWLQLYSAEEPGASQPVWRNKPETRCWFRSWSRKGGVAPGSFRILASLLFSP